MPFCVNCGAQNREGARFCEACGKPVTQLAPGAQPPAPPTPGAYQPVAAAASGSAKMLLLAAAGVYVVGALLILVGGGDIFALVTCLLLVAGIYVAAYMPLTKGQLKTAQQGALGAAVVALVFGFIDMMAGNVLAALFNFVAAALVGLAWNGMKG